MFSGPMGDAKTLSRCTGKIPFSNRFVLKSGKGVEFWKNIFGGGALDLCTKLEPSSSKLIFQPFKLLLLGNNPPPPFPAMVGRLEEVIGTEAYQGLNC